DLLEQLLRQPALGVVLMPRGAVLLRASRGDEALHPCPRVALRLLHGLVRPAVDGQGEGAGAGEGVRLAEGGPVAGDRLHPSSVEMPPPPVPAGWSCWPDRDFGGMNYMQALCV